MCSPNVNGSIEQFTGPAAMWNFFATESPPIRRVDAESERHSQVGVLWNGCDDKFAIVVSVIVGCLLIASGFAHLLGLVVTGTDWAGPVSFRKPGLFGVSAGVTLLSLAWVVRRMHSQRLSKKLRRTQQVGLDRCKGLNGIWGHQHFRRVTQRGDRLILISIAACLFVEVGLITLQFWRGVPSHFHRPTNIDAVVESTLLILISFATLGILWLTMRVYCDADEPTPYRTAILWGMSLLSLSCIVGFGISYLAEWNLAHQRPADIWGAAGVLKYPHGAALHALQLLPILAWGLSSLESRLANVLVHLAGLSQLMFLLHAAWQTLQGRARLDVDLIGGGLLLLSVSLLLLPAIVVAGYLLMISCRTAGVSGPAGGVGGGPN